MTKTTMIMIIKIIITVAIISIGTIEIITTIIIIGLRIKFISDKFESNINVLSLQSLSDGSLQNDYYNQVHTVAIEKEDICCHAYSR